MATSSGSPKVSNARLQSLFKEAKEFDAKPMMQKYIVVSVLYTLLSGQRRLIPSWLPADTNPHEPLFWNKALSNISDRGDEDVWSDTPTSFYDTFRGRCLSLCAQHTLTPMRGDLGPNGHSQGSPILNANGKRSHPDGSGTNEPPQETSDVAGHPQSGPDNTTITLQMWITLSEGIHCNESYCNKTTCNENGCSGSKPSWKKIHKEFKKMVNDITPGKPMRTHKWENFDKHWGFFGLTISLGYIANLNKILLEACSLFIRKLSMPLADSSDAVPRQSYIPIVQELHQFWSAEKAAELESCIERVVDGDFGDLNGSQLLTYILELKSLSEEKSITVCRRSQQDLEGPSRQSERRALNRSNHGTEAKKALDNGSASAFFLTREKILTARESALANKDAAFTAKNKSLEERQKLSSKLEAWLDERDSLCESRESEAKVRETLCDSRESEAKVKEESNQESDSIINTRRLELETDEKVYQAKNKLLLESTCQNEKAKSDIEREKDKINKRQASVSSKERKSILKEQDVNDKEKKAVALQKWVRKKEDEVMGREKVCGTKEENIRAMEEELGREKAELRTLESAFMEKEARHAVDKMEWSEECESAKQKLESEKSEFEHEKNIYYAEARKAWDENDRKLARAAEALSCEREQFDKERLSMGQKLAADDKKLLERSQKLEEEESSLREKMQEVATAWEIVEGKKAAWTKRFKGFRDQMNEDEELVAINSR
ncbi:hypothetical protein V493_08606 [Pseudogymnoascus sp. VKM F-4281 (FW-2241)]|nr:hypothetical protein V493_08606 [Pseudogymnoascus sp. VKM F-4281 (FW-2241)]